MSAVSVEDRRPPRERKCEMESTAAGGMELLTLNSIHSQKNPSQVSLYMKDASSTEMDEDSWSWSYLREQFRIKDLEGLYLRYQRRLQHAYFSIFLMLQLVIGLTHLLILYFASDVNSTWPDMLVYGCLSVICVPMLITTYSEKILKSVPWMQLVLSFVVIFALLAVDIGLPLYHTLNESDEGLIPSNSSDRGPWTTIGLESAFEFEAEKPHLAELESMPLSMPDLTNNSHAYLENSSVPDFLVVRPVYAGYTLLACYVFLPLPDNRQAFIMGLFVTVIHLISYGIFSYQDYADQVPRVIADMIYLACVNILGLYLRFVDEVMIRRTFLDRRACIKCTNMLKYEKDQEEQLMLSILPSHIASQVKEDIRKIFQHIKEHHTTPIRKKPFSELYVERHENVSILYADVVNFTQLTLSLSVKELVETLNELFGSFDEASRDRNVLRIKFLGDCYYCVAGIPQPKPNPDHAKSCVELGLDMIAIIKDVREERGVNVDMRIGVHTGRILSGLLGLCKWQYDIWSLDVEIANHMEMAGKPGKVHVSKQTLLRLENAYQYESGGGADNDPFLAKHKIETYLISPKDKQEEVRRRAYSKTLPNRRQSQGLAKLSNKTYDYYKAKRGLSIGLGEGMNPTRRRMVFMDDNVLLYREMQRRANNYMAEAIDKMPLGKYDQWFQGEEIHPLFLTFENSRWEIPFIQQPDPLFKFYAACATPLIVGMLLVQGIALPRWPNGVFWICFGITSFVVLLFVLLPLFWAQVIWSTWQDPRGELEEPVPPPTQHFLSSCYNAASFLVRSTGARIAAYLFIMFCLICNAFSLLVECQEEPVKGISFDGKHKEPVEYGNCSPPWHFTESVALVVMMNFLFLKIHFGLKLSVSCIVTGIYSWIIWSHKPEFFQSGETSNPTLDPRISHTMYIVFFSLSMHVMDRQMEYMNRLDYKWKRKLIKEQDEASTTRMVNKMLLQNILPIHVAELYLNTNRATELYYEKYDSISVMFASIVPVNEDDEEEVSKPNLSEEYSSQSLGEQLKDDGYGSLRLLNEFICGFDKLLLEPSFMRVEKIKVAGWTYLAACGLQPGRRDSNNSGRSNSRSDDISLGDEIASRMTADNIIVLVRFAANMMNVLEGINKDGFLNFKLRVGIQHGPVMAGVVGAHKPLYDIWGDTVNVAARLDSSGEAGKIQVTEETAMILMKHGVKCEKRGPTYLKGKGWFPTYFITLDDNFGLIIDQEKETTDHPKNHHINLIPQIVIHQPDQTMEQLQETTSGSVCVEEVPCGPPRGDSGFADYEQVEEASENSGECHELGDKNSSVFTKL
ncbi:adenylate cyclase type 7-like isoform X2 [Ischnura elegans]|uniref:adenylate cyclase type 7-like isoform X2 n=1 Tax=Ischnura elegans TaxID=197161 RepID=UPI001ED89922|nr:adenylate cyclase type 7-like isoform X2 [Ischnura elegans]